jgi:uncharacterized membrane protein YjjP (DUF1212 family)
VQEAKDELNFITDELRAARDELKEVKAELKELTTTVYKYTNFLVISSHTHALTMRWLFGYDRWTVLH